MERLDLFIFSFCQVDYNCVTGIHKGPELKAHYLHYRGKRNLLTTTALTNLSLPARRVDYRNISVYLQRRMTSPMTNDIPNRGTWNKNDAADLRSFDSPDYDLGIVNFSMI